MSWNPLKQWFKQVSFDMLLKQLVTKAGAFCKTRRCLQKAKDRALSKRIFVRIKQNKVMNFARTINNFLPPLWLILPSKQVCLNHRKPFRAVHRTCFTIVYVLYVCICMFIICLSLEIYVMKNREQRRGPPLFWKKQPSFITNSVAGRIGQKGISS